MGLAPTEGSEFEHLLWRLGRFSVVVALLLSLASLPFSSFFEVREIEVEGNLHLSREEITALARVPKGVSIFQVDQGTLLGQVAAHPRIRRATAFPRPPHTLVIQVEERRPFTLMEYHGRTWVLDEEGVVIGRAGGNELAPSFPVRLQVSFLSIPAIAPGKPISLEEVRHALEILHSLPREVEGEVRELVVTREGFVLRMRNGIRIDLGGWKGISLRLRRLPRVLQAVRSLEVPVESVDLRFGETVVINPQGKP